GLSVVFLSDCYGKAMMLLQEEDENAADLGERQRNGPRGAGRPRTHPPRHGDRGAGREAQGTNGPTIRPPDGTCPAPRAPRPDPTPPPPASCPRCGRVRLGAAPVPRPRP